MKIIKLQLLDKGIYVGTRSGVGGTIDERTHDFARVTDGFIVRHKATQEVWFVPSALAVAQIAPEPIEEGDDATDAAGRGPGRRGRKAPDPSALPG